MIFPFKISIKIINPLLDWNGFKKKIDKCLLPECMLPNTSRNGSLVFTNIPGVRNRW